LSEGLAVERNVFQACNTVAKSAYLKRLKFVPRKFFRRIPDPVFKKEFIASWIGSIEDVFVENE